MTLPVYILNGFLESGKTSFIKFTLSQKYFQIPGRTLLILCEEGEEEIEKRLLRKSGTDIEVIEDEEDFTVEALEYLEKRYKPERILIELNGMWNPKNIKLPSNWEVEQQITMINAATFTMYYNNMKSLVSEQIRNSELIVFNRCDGIDELPNFKRNIRAVNSRAEVIFEDSNGELNVSLDEELPFDLKADVIEMDDAGFAMFYVDAMDNPARYDGKVIEYIGAVLKPSGFPKGYFVPGRMAMTCCADDMAFLGYVCKSDRADEFKEKDWVKVRAKVKIEYFEAYGGTGPVLYVENIEKTAEPKEPVIDFSKI